MEKRIITQAIREKLGARKSFLVLGDVMLDEYVYGTAERKNPESAAILLDCKTTKYFPGGAANVANNLAALGHHVLLIGLIGEDDTGAAFQRVMARTPHIYFVPHSEKGRPTTRKIRYVTEGGNQHLLRADWESKSHINPTTENDILNRIRDHIKDVDAVIFSDYDKGLFCSPYVTYEVRDLAARHQQPVLADFKPQNANLFTHCTLISPNIKEAQEITGIRREDGKNLEEISLELEKKMLSRYTIITCGKEGILSREQGNGHTKLIGTQERRIYDVVGAGDTVIATLAICLATKYAHKGSDFNIHEAAEVANVAAGVVVDKPGTATVTLKELIECMEHEDMKHEES